MEIRLGTCGWSHPDWKGTFYPAGTKEELSYYAQQFSTVEIDSTFYRTPKAAVVEAWNRQTPDGFVFCPKLPRRITHEHRLEGIKAEDSVRYFLDMVSGLGEKLGPMVIELPPNFTYEQKPTLESFLWSLPNQYRFAVEFRHRSWVDKPEALELLRSLNVGLVMAQHPKYPRMIGATTDFAYLRLMGLYHAFPEHGQLQLPRDEVLKEWVDVVTEVTPQVLRTFVFVSNHLEGYSPATIARFKTILDAREDQLREAA